MLIKYSGKYVKIYFNMKITFPRWGASPLSPPLLGGGFTPTPPTANLTLLT